MGGEIYGVSSQEQASADKAKDAWNLGFPLFGDPQVVVAEALHQRGLLDVYVDADLAEVILKGGGDKYAVGVYQPAVIALTKNFSALFAWAAKPAASNIGGAIGRPAADDVIRAIRAGLLGDLSLVHWEAPQKPRELPFSSFPYVLLVLVFANGNFIAPRPFTFDRDGRGNIHLMLGKATLKLLVTVAIFGAVVHRRRHLGVVIAAIAAYAAYVKVVWGQTIQSGWKIGGAYGNRNALHQHRSKST